MSALAFRKSPQHPKAPRLLVAEKVISVRLVNPTVSVRRPLCCLLASKAVAFQDDPWLSDGIGVVPILSDSDTEGRCPTLPLWVSDP